MSNHRWVFSLLHQVVKRNQCKSQVILCILLFSFLQAQIVTYMRQNYFFYKFNFVSLFLFFSSAFSSSKWMLNILGTPNIPTFFFLILFITPLGSVHLIRNRVILITVASTCINMFLIAVHCSFLATYFLMSLRYVTVKLGLKILLIMSIILFS